MPLVLLILAPLSAHDLYLRPDRAIVEPNARGRVEYHNGDAFPVSQSSTRIERLRSPQTVSAAGTTPLARLRVEGRMTVATYTAPASGHFHVISHTIPNFIQLAPAKFDEYLRHEGLSRVAAWRREHGEAAQPGRELYSKHVKALLVAGKGDEFFSRPVGLTVEFVALDDPYQTRPGGTIRALLLFRGKPAAGHPVQLQRLSGGKVTTTALGNTDTGGRIAVPAPAAGFYKLHSIVMERREDRSQADWESFWTTLTFTVPPPVPGRPGSR